MKNTFNIGNEFIVNRLGYGAMRITGTGIWGPPANKEEAIKVLRKAVELGVDFIDTADSYGPNVSEELIAEALHPYVKGLVIATKGGFERTGPNQWNINSSPEHLKTALEGSLRRLKVDTIDLYQLHRIDPKVPFDETLTFLKKAQEQGKIRHIGLSEVSVKEIKQAQEFVEIVSVQNKYSIDFRKWEGELNYCNDNNIAFIPWNPIQAGHLQEEGPLAQIAANHSASINQIALSWLLHHSPNILLIPGTSQVKHLEENIAAGNIRLTDEEMKMLDKI
jgi:aryl-alcohol dehydrogenase-like predicted oxidoreductase